MISEVHTSVCVNQAIDTRRFGSRIAVNILEFHVPCGFIYAFLGANSAGKNETTGSDIQPQPLTMKAPNN
jgi:hypothetical protein